MYVGGLSEKIVGDNNAVGPTFGCILMDQFEKIKKSDRFYYENGPRENSGAFTMEQLREIRHISLAGLICNNYDLLNIQTSPFQRHSSR